MCKAEGAECTEPKYYSSSDSDCMTKNQAYCAVQTTVTAYMAVKPASGGTQENEDCYDPLVACVDPEVHDGVDACKDKDAAWCLANEASKTAFMTLKPAALEVGNAKDCYTPANACPGTQWNGIGSCVAACAGGEVYDVANQACVDAGSVCADTSTRYNAVSGTCIAKDNAYCSGENASDVFIAGETNNCAALATACTGETTAHDGIDACMNDSCAVETPVWIKATAACSAACSGENNFHDTSPASETPWACRPTVEADCVADTNKWDAGTSACIALTAQSDCSTQDGSKVWIEADGNCRAPASGDAALCYSAFSPKMKINGGNDACEAVAA